MPEGLRHAIDYDAWERPALFRLIQERGEVPEDDMRRSLNLGIGLVAVVPADRLDTAMDRLQSTGERPIPIGEVVSGDSTR